MLKTAEVAENNQYDQPAPITSLQQNLIGDAPRWQLMPAWNHGGDGLVEPAGPDHTIQTVALRHPVTVTFTAETGAVAGEAAGRSAGSVSPGLLSDPVNRRPPDVMYR